MTNRERAQKIVEALEAVEWACHDGDGDATCPDCGFYEFLKKGHHPDCGLDAALSHARALLDESGQEERDHEAMERVRRDRIGSLEFAYNAGDLIMMEPEVFTRPDPADAVLAFPPPPVVSQEEK